MKQKVEIDTLLGDRVIIKIPKIKINTGDFKVPDTELDTSQIISGNVFSIGELVKKVKVGDLIMIEPFQSSKIPYTNEDNEYFLTKEEFIICKLK